MALALPRLMQLAPITKHELIANGQADLAALQLRQAEPRRALLVETEVPPHNEGVLGLRLLDALVVIGLDLDQGAEDVLVVVRVVVPVQ